MSVGDIQVTEPPQSIVINTKSHQKLPIKLNSLHYLQTFPYGSKVVYTRVKTHWDRTEIFPGAVLDT